MYFRGVYHDTPQVNPLSCFNNFFFVSNRNTSLKIIPIGLQCGSVKNRQTPSQKKASKHAPKHLKRLLYFASVRFFSPWLWVTIGMHCNYYKSKLTNAPRSSTFQAHRKQVSFNGKFHTSLRISFKMDFHSKETKELLPQWFKCFLKSNSA